MTAPLQRTVSPLEAALPMAAAQLVPAFVWPGALLFWIGVRESDEFLMGTRLPFLASVAVVFAHIAIPALRPPLSESAWSVGLRVALAWGFTLVWFRALLEGFGQVSTGFDDYRNYTWVWHQPLPLAIGMLLSIVTVAIMQWWWWRGSQIATPPS